LEQSRQNIDHIDEQIIDLLAQRFAIVMKIWSYKKRHNMLCLDAVRRNALLQSKLAYAKKQWLSEKFIIDIWERIHQESLHIQK
jgi:chorismate mutase